MTSPFLSCSRLPSIITPCPIAEAIVELRFVPKLPEAVILGLIYQELGKQYPKVVKLPIVELPEVIRKNDPSLIYKPYHQLKDQAGQYTVLSSPNLIAITCVSPYTGWEKFSARVREAFAAVEKIGLVDKGVRLGVRYVNVFKEENICANLNLAMTYNSSQVVEENVSMRIGVPVEQFFATISVDNSAAWSSDGSKAVKGSVIDIDLAFNNIDPAGIVEKIEKAHELEKKIFFSLLKEDYLKQKFNPKY